MGSATGLILPKEGYELPGNRPAHEVGVERLCELFLI